MSARVALVTGSNSGLGMSLTLMLAREGYHTYASMRDLEKGAALLEQAAKEGLGDNIRPLQLDVASDASVEKAFAEVLAAEGRLDLLVNNAGYSLFGTLEMLSMDQVRAQFDTNFFGAVRCTKAALPAMRRQRSGKVVYISSIGGVWGQTFNDIYCASKFALAGMAESQAALFREFGVYVTLVEPGGIKSAFLANAQRPDMAAMAPEYVDPIQRVLGYYSRGSSAQTSEEVAQVIMDKVVKVDAPTLRVQTNLAIEHIFKAQLVDPTGETAVEINRTRLLAPL